MKVLITGAMGNVGSNCVPCLLQQHHEVKCFDIRTKANEKRWKKFKGRVEMVWGDLCCEEDVAAAVKDREAIIHLGFMLPPWSDEKPELAERVNVGGTRKLIEQAKKQASPPRFVFASSFSVFGETQHLPPPRRATDPVNPADNYTRHKVECERMLKESGLEWVVTRLGVVPPRSLGGFTPKMFEAPVGARIEFAHPDDIGLALANAITSKEAVGKTLLLGGGPGCQLYYIDFVNRMMQGMGVGKLPECAFAVKASAFTDWLDTVEAQQVLQFQGHTFDDFVKEMSDRLGMAKIFMRAFAPLIRLWMLRQSPHYRARNARPAGAVQA